MSVDYDCCHCKIVNHLNTYNNFNVCLVQYVFVCSHCSLHVQLNKLQDEKRANDEGNRTHTHTRSKKNMNKIRWNNTYNIVAGFERDCIWNGKITCRANATLCPNMVSATVRTTFVDTHGCVRSNYKNTCRAEISWKCRIKLLHCIQSSHYDHNFTNLYHCYTERIHRRHKHTLDNMPANWKLKHIFPFLTIALA